VATLAALGHDIGRAPRKGFPLRLSPPGGQVRGVLVWALLGTLSDLRHDQRQRGKPGRNSGLSGSPYSAPPSAHRFPARPWSEAQAERGATIAVRGVTTPVAQMRMRPPANAKAPPAPSGSARKKGTGGGGAPEKSERASNRAGNAKSPSSNTVPAANAI